MLLVIPFIIISIYSYLISSVYKISIIRSYLTIIISLTFFLIFLGKFGFLTHANELIKYFTFFLLIYLFFKKKFNSSQLLEVFFLFILFFLLIWICKDFYYYKYDEFSEYGITTKLIFSENNLPSNIDYLQKGSHHKINFISYFHYFFLKNSTDIFREDITFLAHSFLKTILIITILSFINLNFNRKIIIGIIFYFIIYTLGPGFDRLYVDSIVGLFISVILLIFFNEQNKKSDFLLLFLIVSAFPMIKPNALVIICGLLPIFLFYAIFQKKVISLTIIIIAILFNYLFTKFYIHSFQEKDLKKIEKIYFIHSTQAFHLGNFDLYNVHHFKKIINNRNDFISTQFKELKENGIYHAKTFLILNKVLDQINFELKTIEIPINIFFWLLIILLIGYFISKKDKKMKILWLITLYLSFLVTYFIFLTYWASKHNLINDDLTMSISWERHLGTIILGIILFLLTHYFKIYKNYIILISALVVSLNITLPNSIRVFMPVDIINKNQFWEKKYQQRAQIKNISKEIKNKLDDYSNLLFLIDKPDDPYFLPILKYELIKINSVDKTSDNIVPFFNGISLKYKKFYIITDNNESVIKNLFQTTTDKKKLTFIENLFQTLNKRYDNKLILKKKYFINNLSIYEISTI